MVERLRATVKSVAALCLLVFVVFYITSVYLSEHKFIKSSLNTYREKSLRDSINDDHFRDPTLLCNTSNNRETPQTEKSLSPHTRGYVLSGKFWEQFTSASRNLQSLQCWAKKVGVKVVEPFGNNSMLGTPLDLVPSKNSLKFSDLIDLKSWNRESRENGNEEIVVWETFIREAPKDIIAVDFNDASSKELIDIQKDVNRNPEKYPPRELRYKQCPPDRQGWPTQNLLNGFNVIRKVCLNLAYGDSLSMEEFKASVYDTLDPSTTTVYFRQWKGLGFGRVPIEEPGCYVNSKSLLMSRFPSPMLVRHTIAYISSYLSNAPYIAIIARLEKSKIISKNKPGIVPYCLTQTLNQWRELASNIRLNTTFLSIDMGKYRSKSFKYDDEIQRDFKEFFHSIYGNQWSISEWERSFEEVAGTTDAGYIALLQKMIVTRATCVVFVGGGSFQAHALSLYQARVPKSDRCFQVVKECTGEHFGQ